MQNDSTLAIRTNNKFMIEKLLTFPYLCSKNQYLN